MHVEVSVALNFVISYLYNKLPRRRVDMFAAELENGLKKKFEGHWYPDKPNKGSGFRCVRMNGEKVDPVIINAAFNLGLDLDEVKSYLPEELTLWIDPTEVSYRIGEKGPVRILYSERKDEDSSTETADREVQAAGKGFNPDAQCFKPIDTLSSSLNNLCLSSGGLSPSSPTSSNGWPGSASTSPSTALFNSAISAPAPAPPPFRHHKDNSQTQFTAAMFAQTKFGSTKLKTQAKRPTRLSPTEFGNFLRQRSVVVPQGSPVGYSSPQRPRSLSPRDPRVEFLVDQQQRMIMSQQQLQQQQQKLLQLQQQQQQQMLHSPQHLHSPSMLADTLSQSTPSPSQAPGNSFGNFADFLPSPSSSIHSPMSSAATSPDSHKTFIDGINVNNVSYSNQFSHLLLAN